MLCVDDLLTLDAFRQLPQARLEWVCDRVKPIHLLQGEILLPEGDNRSTRGVFILAKGRMSITRLQDGVEMPIGQHDAPNFFGEIPVLTEEPAVVTMRAVTNCQLYKLAAVDFLTLLHEYRDFERAIFRTFQRRLRGLESFIRVREKMAALGTLAAGLAHELNNPAAALVRSLNGIIPAIQELERMNLIYGQRQVAPEDSQRWLAVRDAGFDAIANNRVDLISLSDREDELLEWLENYGVEQAWKLAAPLAAAGVEIQTLEELTQPWKNDPTELRDQGLRWLALSFEVLSMIRGGLRGAERIATLVSAMKSYTYLDQGAQQIVNIHEGLEDTLQLFCHKLKYGITVHRSYDPSLPKILAYGSELNQVWTNLIDNAIDAMDGQGTLEITTFSKKNHVRVEIIDSGSGIPADIQSRIFEPFFTTKPVGKGSGLGLETVRRIVENRHRGSILVESVPGRTCFTVWLPTQ
ncbi:cyclic nucleotide-binding domain-containing protein [Tolypothrix campylonemoides VB511288]|nr:cyclic nucleotide-binding domain-containing protein [Tolypothrix campylonemoides VB511288]